MTDDFEGIMFTLKKMNNNVIDIEDKNKESNFVNFGYYDRLSVDLIQKWYSFRPMGLAKIVGYVSNDGKYADMYTIRGVFPVNCNAKSYKSFDYNIWRDIGAKTSQIDELTTSPYICMSSVHLSGEFAASCQGLDEMLERILDLIKGIAEDQEINLKENHCAIFPVIGFSDFVILFLTSDLAVPAKIIKDLRACKYREKIVISNCYTTCGIFKYYQFTNNDLHIDTKARLSVRFNLREGVSAKDFHFLLNDTIIDRVNNKFEDMELAKEVKKELDDYYITFGNADTLIMPNMNIVLFLSMTTEDSIKDDEQLWKMVSNIRTSICVIEQLEDIKYEDEKDESDNYVPSNIMIGCEKPSWRNFFKDFEQQLRENNYPVRMSRSLEQMIRNYYNLINTSHGFDVKNCLDNFIDAVFESIRLCFRNADWTDTRESISVFRDRVGDFIADLIRSDKPFIEGNSVLHPAIGSATKMLFTYTSILNEVANKMPDDDNKIIFLVISGGADRTKAVDLFHYLHKGMSDDDYIRPVLIVVPEKSLYDIRGTLFRLFHECMHYCCERKRDYRYSAFVEMLAKTIAEDLTNDYFQTENLTPYKSGILDYIQEDAIREKISQRIETIYIQSRDMAMREMYNDVIKVIKNDKEVEDKDFYYEYKLFSRGNKDNNIGILYTDYVATLLYSKEKDMHNKFVNTINKYEMEFHDNVIEYLEDNNIDSTYANLARETLIYRREADTDNRARQLVDIYISLFVDNYGCAEIKKYYKHYTYNKIAELGYKSMREARADLCAIKLLNLDFADYLLAFIYEEKSIDRAMPMTADNIFRMGSVLKLAYGVGENGFESRKEEVFERAEAIAEAGFIYEQEPQSSKNYIKDYMNRIGALLEKYEDSNNKTISDQLENYLKEVVKEVVAEKNKLDDKLKVLGQCDMNDKNSCYEAVKGLFHIWKSLGGVDINGITDKN